MSINTHMQPKHKRLVFLLISIPLLIGLAIYLFGFAAITSAPLFGVEPSSSEKTIAALCIIGAVISLAMILPSVILSRRIR